MVFFTSKLCNVACWDPGFTDNNFPVSGLICPIVYFNPFVPGGDANKWKTIHFSGSNDIPLVSMFCYPTYHKKSELYIL